MSLAVGTLLLYSFLNQRALNRFDQALTKRLTQIAVALSLVSDDPGRLGELLLDPQYQKPLSGLQWLVTAPDGQIHASPSLLDAALPGMSRATTTFNLADATSPDVEEMRIAEQVISLEDRSGWTVAAPESLSQLKDERMVARSAWRRAGRWEGWRAGSPCLRRGRGRRGRGRTADPAHAWARSCTEQIQGLARGH